MPRAGWSSPNGLSGCSAVDAAHAQVLHHEVVLDAVLGALASHPRLLDAAEGRNLGRDDAGVDADDPVLERLGDAPHAVEVTPVEVRREPELSVVGEPD